MNLTIILSVGELLIWHVCYTSQMSVQTTTYWIFSAINIVSNLHAEKGIHRIM